MSFYKDENECRLFKDNYEAAEAYGPGGTYAVKFENIVNPTFTQYSNTYSSYEALGDGTYKITRTSNAPSGYWYSLQGNKTVTDIIKLNHKYYFQCDVNVNRLVTTDAILCLETYYNNQLFTIDNPSVVDTWETKSKFFTVSTLDTSYLKNRILFWYGMTDGNGFQNGDYFMFRKPIFIDLTQSFGEGNEPTTQVELYEALPQLANGGYMTPVATTTLAQTYIPTTHKTSYWIGEDCDVHFNQINDNSYNGGGSRSGITFTRLDDLTGWTISGTSTAYTFCNTMWKTQIYSNFHKYLVYCPGLSTLNESSTVLEICGYHGISVSQETMTFRSAVDATFFTAPTTVESLTGHLYRFTVWTTGSVIPETTLRPMLFDLTEMFGEGYEPTTVEEFTRMYTDTYYPYTPSLIIPSTSNYNTAYKNRDGVTFNQLFTIPDYPSSTVSGITYTNNNNGSVTLNGTATDISYWKVQSGEADRIIKGHTYLFPDFINNSTDLIEIRWWDSTGTCIQPHTAVFKATTDGWNSSGVFFQIGRAGKVFDNVTLWPMLFDLTKIYGYGNEPTTVEEFKKDFPDTYYKYTEGKQTAIRVCDKPIYRGYLNQVYNLNSSWDPQTRDGITLSYDNTTKLYHATGTVAKGTADHNIYINATCTMIGGHKYYIRLNGGKYTSMYVYLGWTTHPVPYSYGAIAIAQDSESHTNVITIRFHDYTTDGDVVDEYFYPEIIDLTALFGEGNEPTEPRICNELFGSNHVAYQTNTAIDSPLNLKAILQEQVTTKLVGYDTNTITGTGDITVSGTYNDPIICQYVPTETTQATSTGANLIDLGRYCKRTEDGRYNSVNLQHLPDGRFKWTANHVISEDNLGTPYLDIFTDKDGNNITVTSGQSLTFSFVVDETYITSTSTSNNLVTIWAHKTDTDEAQYIGVILRSHTPGSTRYTVTATAVTDLDQIRLYLENHLQIGDYVIFHDFMFEIDTNVGTYEPYNHAQAGPSPANPLPVVYNQCQEITINPGVTPTITSLEDTPKLIWAPTDYSTDFTYQVHQPDVNMKYYMGTDYVKFCPLVSKSTTTSQDTAWTMKASNISLTAGKMYAFVFKYKKYNCSLKNLQAFTSGTSSSYRCCIVDSNGTVYSGTESTEYPILSHWFNSSGYDTVYDEGWSWYRFTAPTTDTYTVGIGVDTPNTLSADLSKESYIQLTNVGIYEGTFGSSSGWTINHNTVLNDDLERKLITNQQLGSVRQGATNIVPDTYSPYMDNEGTMQSCKIQRNIVQVFDGTESGWQKSSSHTHSFTFSLSAIDGFDENSIINYGWCSHFTKFSSNSEIDTKNGIYMYYTWAIYITQMDCTTLAEFKAWLAKEAKTNPVVVVAGIANASDYKITYGDPIKANLLPYQSIISHNGSSLTVKAKQYRDTRVPNGYTRLKYLQSNGTQYIDTGYCPSYKTGARVDAQYMEIQNAAQDRLLGVTVGSTTTGELSFDMYLSGGTTFSYSRSDNLGNWGWITTSDTNRHIFTIKDGYATVDTASATTPTCSNTSSTSMYLFWSQLVGSGSTGKSKARIYSCKLYENDTVIHYYLPCLDATNTPCMYDTITGTSYYNSGTGDDFTYEIL